MPCSSMDGDYNLATDTTVDALRALGVSVSPVAGQRAIVWFPDHAEASTEGVQIGARHIRIMGHLSSGGIPTLHLEPVGVPLDARVSAAAGAIAAECSPGDSITSSTMRQLFAEVGEKAIRRYLDAVAKAEA